MWTFLVVIVWLLWIPAAHGWGQLAQGIAIAVSVAIAARVDLLTTLGDGLRRR